MFVSGLLKAQHPLWTADAAEPFVLTHHLDTHRHMEHITGRSGCELEGQGASSKQQPLGCSRV